MGKLTVSYDGDKIINTSQDGSFTLVTKDKVLTDNVDIQFDGDGWSDEEAFEHKYTAGSFTYEGTRLLPFTFCYAPFTEFSAPNLIRFGMTDTGGIGSYVFYNCENLEKINLPELIGSGSGGYQFANCKKLTDIYMPKCNAGQHMFEGCSALKRIALPYLNYPSGSVMNGSGFTNCTSLEVVDLGNVSRIDVTEFSGATKLATLIIRFPTSVCALRYTSAFTNTPFASGKSGGTLYVPQALIESYQAATNWSTILGYTNNQILPLEGSEYENTYADGRPVVQEETT